jgi:hypothetical protein
MPSLSVAGHDEPPAAAIAMIAKPPHNVNGCKPGPAVRKSTVRRWRTLNKSVTAEEGDRAGASARPATAQMAAVIRLNRRQQHQPFVRFALRPHRGGEPPTKVAKTDRRQKSESTETAAGGKWNVGCESVGHRRAAI